MAKRILDLVTTSRASDGYSQDSSGVWHKFSSNVPRVTSKGLLIEESRTNYVRNNSMQGAAAGILGSGGSLPSTGWSVNAAGTTFTIVGTGTQNGIEYIDVRWAGTTNNTFANLVFDGNTIIAASNGQTWTGSAFIALVSGSFTNVTSISLRAGLWSSTPTYLGEAWVPTLHTSFPATLSSSSRLSHSGTIANASTTVIQPYIQLVFASGVAIDITLRIGWPQLELGAFVTSPIRTTSAAVFRAADVVSLTNATGIIPDGAPFSLFVQCIPFGSFTSNPVTAVPFGWMNDLTFTNGAYISIGNSTGTVAANIIRSAGSQFSGSSVNVTTGRVKIAMRGATNNSRMAANGTLSSLDTSVTLPAGAANQLKFGSAPWNAGGNYLNGYIERAALYLSELSDAQLQALTV